MNHLSYDLGTIGPDDIIEVTLDHSANVQLLNPADYQAYKNGKTYRYHGGYVKENPFRIRPPHRGHWYVVVDLGGAAGTVRASVRVLPRSLVAEGAK